MDLEGTDAKLVERCLKGDARAWEVLVRGYSGRIFNMALRYTGRYDLSEELTQDVFLKLFENLSSFNPRSGSFRNWIMRVGRNLIIDHYRAHRREKNVAGSEELEVLDFQDHSRQPSPFESVHLKEKAGILMEALIKLNLELREAVILRDIEGYTYQEMAELLEIPEGTVKSRINRGRVELARQLRQRWQEEA